MILAIDLGTTMGWAVGNSVKKDGYKGGGSIKLCDKKNTQSAERYINFKEKITSLINKYNPDEIFYERIFKHTGTIAAHVYGGFKTQLEIIAESFYKPLHFYTPTHIKFSFVGNGHADKEQIMKGLSMTEWKIDAEDHNHADACAILFTALNEINFYKTNQQKRKK